MRLREICLILFLRDYKHSTIQNFLKFFKKKIQYNLTSFASSTTNHLVLLYHSTLYHTSTSLSMFRSPWSINKTSIIILQYSFILPLLLQLSTVTTSTSIMINALKIVIKYTVYQQTRHADKRTNSKNALMQSGTNLK